MNTKPISIDDFISKFKEKDKNGVLEETFLNGFCYFFSVILKEKFPRGSIFYSEKENHFLFMLNGILYDIRGNVASKYSFQDIVLWDSWWDDMIHKQRIIRDCIEKEDILY